MTAHELIAALKNVTVLDSQPDHVILRVDLPYSVEAPPFDTLDWALTQPGGLQDAKREMEEWFDEFWTLYPRKVGKGAARKAAWKHGKTPEARAAILAGLRRQLPGFRGKEPEYIPHPATWLNQERWTDAVDLGFGGGKPTAFVSTMDPDTARRLRERNGSN